MKKKPKIVFWDIETSGIIATTWNLYPESIAHQNMLQDWFIVCVAWKEQGKKKVHTVSVLDDPERFKKNNADDYFVIKTLRDMLEDVDILIHHNGNSFDLKAFTARLIFHKLPPLPKFLTIDTLREVKKVAKFTSHRLDFLGQVLCGEGKMQTPPGTWLKAMKGDRSAIKLMLDYNKVDVIVLEKVYDAIRPYIKNHPHIGALNGEDKNHSCKACGSTELKKNGTRLTAAGIKRQEWQCTSCGSYSSYPILKLDGIN